MPCHAAQTKADARMLDGLIGIIQLCAHCANVRPLGKHQHFLNPVRRDNLGVVVEQKQILSSAKLYAVVVDRRVVELSLPGDDAHIGMLPLYVFIIGKELSGCAVILHNDDLIIRPGRFCKDGIQTGLELFEMLIIGDQDGYLRLPLDNVSDAIDRETRPDRFDFAFESKAFELFFHCPDSRLSHIGFNPDTLRNRARVRPPIVEDFRDMRDALCLLRQAQHHIVIL